MASASGDESPAPGPSGVRSYGKFLWEMHAKIALGKDALGKEYELHTEQCRHIHKDLKFHLDQCEILTDLAKQREECDAQGTWTTHSWNVGMETALAVFDEHWNETDTKLYSRLESPKPLIVELARLRQKLEAWAGTIPEIRRVLSPRIPTVPEEISTPVLVPTRALMPRATLLRTPTFVGTGAHPKSRTQATIHLTEDLRRLFDLCERESTPLQRSVPTPRPEMEAQTSTPDETMKPKETRVETPTPRERTELYTSVGMDRNQTLQDGFRNMNILGQDGGQDSASLNIRLDGVHRPNTRSITDTPRRTECRQTLPETQNNQDGLVAVVDRLVDRLLANQTSRSGSR